VLGWWGRLSLAREVPPSPTYLAQAAGSRCRHFALSNGDLGSPEVWLPSRRSAGSHRSSLLKTPK
jgi:hypothetical protein